MLRLYIVPVLVFAFACASDARTPLRAPPTSEERAAGEAAMVQVCGFPLDVESEITDEHRAARYNAWYYIGHAVERMEIGDLSSSFSAETLEACGTNATEWGGVRGAVSQLIARYGTDAEMEAQLDQMSAPELFCQAAPRIESLTRYQDICERRYPTLEER